jgi:hypothetical protein
MLESLVRAMLLLLVFVPLADAADGHGHGRRVALVIGNGSYQQVNLPKLPNPPNDAEDVARVLRGFGFDVIERKNQSLEGMNRAIAEWGSRLGGSEAALFYFAGHGIQVKNQNYLMPVNARIDSEAAVPYQGVNLNQVLEEMDNAGSATNIVILDACRNNPITGKFRSGQTRGLASPGAMPRGTVIAYATEPGNVAADGEGRNGLFTAGLLTAFKGRDLTLDGVLTVASAAVEQASGQKQTPYVNGPKTLQKSFNFRVSVDPGQGEIERTFWTSIERSQDPADFEAYLRQYPNGSYKALAENRLRQLRTPAAAAQVAPVAAAATVSAYDGRWAISLVCEDVTIKESLVKGYTFNFFVDIKAGQLTGQKGAIGTPASLTMLGTVQGDGSLEINASGLTGRPDTSVGHVQPGLPYSYRMRGALTATGGKATRIDLRPCEATFFRN